MPLDGLAQAVLAGGARRADGREDPATERVQLLVARTAGAERELVDAVAAERRMRVAVDEPRDRTEPAPVHLDDVAAKSGQVAHAAHRLDRLATAEDVRVLEHLDRAERAAAERRLTARWRRELREVADEQRHVSRGTDGIAIPPCAAASSASS